MPPTPTERCLRVRGTVQGVGFRPFVARLARELGLAGWVKNDTEGVLIRVAGTGEPLRAFRDRLVAQAPAAASITAVEDVAPTADGNPIGDSFAIIESASAAGPVTADVPVDLAPCPDCLREFTTPGDRREGYVFINCTQCGPRYSIIESLPYDRPRTTMHCFQMCPDCGREYADPTDRRFHAEPNACPVCGPELRLTDADGNVVTRREAALAAAIAALQIGRIVAVKGVGGFHLMVDAQNEHAVAELRRRKHREEKPLAVMFSDAAMLSQWAEVDAGAAAELQSVRRPIVLVPRKSSPGLGASVAPGNPWIGALLPPSPLHVRLLAAFGRPLVATSANLSDEPLCTDDDEARRRLHGIADLFLGNNRPIARPVDDSVLRPFAGADPIVLRRARGFAPSPLRLPAAFPHPVLCVGAHLKNTIAVASDRRLIVSPHIGDLDSPATFDVFERTIRTLSGLFRAEVREVVCDKHPDYASTRHADRSGLPRTAVQHHLAHVLAVLLEHGHPADDVLGVSWDGTGFGEDGTIWGGEFILLRRGRAERFAMLRPFRLPGGDAAVRDPRRVAMALASDLGPDRFAAVATRLAVPDRDASMLQKMIARQVNAPWCSSAGRLFDGFGAILGLGTRNSFEGQTPLAVEIAATRSAGGDFTLPLPVRPSSGHAVFEVDWRPALDIAASADRSEAAAIAAAFHRGLAHAIAEVATAAGVSTVALAGGCFQNVMLRELSERALRDNGHAVIAARQLPPNDGGISAGQALGALLRLTTVDLPDRSTQPAEGTSPAAAAPASFPVV